METGSSRRREGQSNVTVVPFEKAREEWREMRTFISSMWSTVMLYFPLGHILHAKCEVPSDNTDHVRSGY